MTAHPAEDEVLILAPTSRDAVITADVLQSASIGSRPCVDVGALCAEIVRGAACAIVAEEAFGNGTAARLATTLANQPAWSDFPLIVLAERARADTSRPLATVAPLGNVTVLDRPMKVTTLLAAVRAAIRGRRRQYESRSAIESRDQFLAMLGHELRNPLGGVLMAAQLLGSTEDPAARETQRAIIERQARHLARLVDDLLDVARVSHGKIVLHEERVDLGELLHQALQSAGGGAAPEHRFSIATELGLVVWADRLRLEQVFGNLISNAVKYTPKGGSIRIEAVREGEHARVSIIDTGVGLEPAMQSKVFDLFTQVSRNLDRSQGGLGVGLTVVKNLVHLHGGEVEARSEGMGRGTELRVHLPLAVETTVPPPPPEEPTPVAPTRIVVVEDSDDLRELLCAMLTHAGHSVSSAADGPGGVERILAERPDVAFVDIGLPGLDGYEVARQVRAAGASDVALVALTGYGQRDDTARARDAGFDEHATKPVDLKKVRALVAKLTGAR
jgi:signal transduction histidine kinase